MLSAEWLPEPAAEVRGIKRMLRKKWERWRESEEAEEFMERARAMTAGARKKMAREEIMVYRDRARASARTRGTSILIRYQKELEVGILEKYLVGSLSAEDAVGFAARGLQRRSQRGGDGPATQITVSRRYTRWRADTAGTVHTEQVIKTAVLGPNSTQLSKLRSLAPMASHSTAWLLGRTYQCVGERPAKIAGRTNLPSAFIQTRGTEGAGPERILVHPGVETSWTDLESCMFSEASTGTSADVVSLCLKGIRGTHSSWGLPSIMVDPISSTFQHGIFTKPATSSGWGEDADQGRTMGCSASFAAVRLEERFRAIMREPVPNTAPWVIGGRAKRTDIGLEDKVLKARAVVYPGAESRLVSGMYSQWVTRSFAASRGGIWVGRKLDYSSTEDLRARCLKGLWQRGVDWRRCGFNLPELLVVAGLACAFSLFPQTRELRNVFLHEAAGVAAKTVLLPGGWVYKVTKGSPSGPWTSIIDTFANSIIFGSCYAMLGVPRSPPFEFYGDDSVEHITPGKSKPYSQLRDKAQELWGMKGDEEAEEGELYTQDESDAKCTFLKRYFYCDVPTRKVSAWRDVSELPERKRDSPESQLERIVYVKNEPMPNPEAHNYFKDYFQYVGDTLGLIRRDVAAAFEQNCSQAVARFYEAGKGIVLQPDREGKMTLRQLRYTHSRLVAWALERSPNGELRCPNIWRSFAWRVGASPYFPGFCSYSGCTPSRWADNFRQPYFDKRTKRQVRSICSQLVDNWGRKARDWAQPGNPKRKPAYL
uniref:RdRp n=1 Tax=viral metagenome TaxID=1070528 RepID=A0A2V0RA33_9ZZZZ